MRYRIRSRQYLVSAFILVVILLGASQASATSHEFSGGKLAPEDQHFYSVLFRENGEAIVGAKLIFENNTPNPLTEFSFRITKPVRQGPVMVQELRTCKAGYSCPTDEPSDFVGSSPRYETSFMPVQHRAERDTYTVSLAEAIQPNGKGAILMRFRSFGYAGFKLFGRRRFVFETFDVDRELKSVQVAATVDQDLYVKGGKARVEFQETRESLFGLGESAGGMMELGTTLGTADVRSSEPLRRFSEVLVRGGQITKTAQALAAHETFKVKGAYATTKIGLYWRRIAIVAAILVALVIVLRRWGGLVWRRRPALRQGGGGGGVGGSALLRSVSPEVGSVIVGLLEAAFIVAVSYVRPLWLVDRFLRGVPYGLMLLFVFVLFIAFLGIIIGIPVWYGKKYGKKYGLLAAASTVGWLVIIILLFALMGGIGSGSGRDRGYYPYDGGFFY